MGTFRAVLVELFHSYRAVLVPTSDKNGEFVAFSNLYPDLGDISGIYGFSVVFLIIIEVWNGCGLEFVVVLV